MPHLEKAGALVGPVWGAEPEKGLDHITGQLVRKKLTFFPKQVLP